MSPREALQALTAPSKAGAFALGPELCSGCRLAKTHEGLSALALAVTPSGTSTPRRLPTLHYDPPRALEIVGDAGRRIESFATLACRTKDAAIEDAFLRIARALLDSPGGGLTEAALERRIDEFVCLFRALSKPATQTIQALWCELAVVLWAPEPRVALRAWHSAPPALHAFASGPDRLEVKSCSTGLHDYALRLEQLHEAPGGRTLFVSILADEDDEGSTVSDLVGLVLARVGTDVQLRRHLETTVTRSLGREWSEAANKRFSLVKARRGLAVYDARDIPTVPGPIPTEVKHVAFTVDLSGTTPLSRRDARARGGFFAHMLEPASV